MYGKNIFLLSGRKKSLKFGLLNQNTPLIPTIKRPAIGINAEIISSSNPELYG